MAKLTGGTTSRKPGRTPPVVDPRRPLPPIKPPPVPVVTPRGTFTPGVQPWVNPRAAESAAIGQAVAGAINTVAGAITTGPGGQVGRGSIGVGDWRNLAVNIPSAIPTRTVGPAGRAGLPAGAGFTTGMAAQGETQRLLTARYGAPTGQQAETQRILAGRYGASRTAAMRAAQEDREQAYVLMARYGMAPPELIPGTSSYQERQRTLTARYSAQAPTIATMGGQAKRKLRPDSIPVIDTGGYGQGDGGGGYGGGGGGGCGRGGGGYGGGSGLINWRIGY